MRLSELSQRRDDMGHRIERSFTDQVVDLKKTDGPAGSRAGSRIAAFEIRLGAIVESAKAVQATLSEKIGAPVFRACVC